MKKLVLLILIFITNNSVAQNSKLLIQADSLFEKKKYIDASDGSYCNSKCTFGFAITD